MIFYKLKDHEITQIIVSPLSLIVGQLINIKDINTILLCCSLKMKQHINARFILFSINIIYSIIKKCLFPKNKHLIPMHLLEIKTMIFLYLRFQHNTGVPNYQCYSVQIGILMAILISNFNSSIPV